MILDNSLCSATSTMILYSRHKALRSTSSVLAGLHTASAASLKRCSSATCNEEFQEYARRFACVTLAPVVNDVDQKNVMSSRAEFWRFAGEHGLHGKFSRH